MSSKKTERLVDALSSLLIILGIIGIFILVFIIRKPAYLVPTVPSFLLLLWILRLERSFKVHLPAMVRFLGTLLLTMHIYGYSLRLYERIDAWDKIEHLIAGATIGAAATAVAVGFRAKENFKLRPSTLILIAVVFGLGIGALWEIFEFAIDQMRTLNFSILSGRNQLQWGNTDTMLDTILNGIGGLIAGVMTLLAIDIKAHRPHPFVSAFLKRREV